MEPPSEAIQQLLVRLALFSTTASTLMKPTGPTLKDDIEENLRTFSPIYSIGKAIWLVLFAVNLRLPRIMTTKLILWLTLSLYAHWQVCGADQSKHMKHNSFVHFARRAILLGATLPAFVAMVMFDHHRWAQIFMAFLVGDAVVTEALTIFTPPRPGTIYLRKNWPNAVLLGPRLGETEISTEIDCQSLKVKVTEKAEDDSTEQGKKDDSTEETPSGQKKREETDKPPQNLCNRVQRVSDSLLGTDVEANASREDITKDICTMLRLLYPFRTTWTCKHKLCFVYKACSLLGPLVLLTTMLGAAGLVLVLFILDIQPLLPVIRDMIDDTFMYTLCFVAFESFFAGCISLYILFVLALILRRVPKLQSLLDSLYNRLARLTGFSLIRIKTYIKAIFIIWPMQAYACIVHLVPMTDTKLSIFLTFLFFSCYSIVGWGISARLVARGSEDTNDAKDSATGPASVGKGTTFKAKAEMAFSLMFIPVAVWFAFSEF